MSDKKMNLNIDSIIDKEFKTSKVGGYSKADVDEFLNLIIEDYESFTDIIEEVHQANKKFKAQNKKLNDKINELLNNNDEKSDNLENQEHLSVVQRLSNLENEVYKIQKSLKK